MKKKVLFIAALFTAGLSFAQDGLTSKKGVPILPEAGDYAIGFDAGNLVNYAGNLFNGAAGNAAGNLNLMNTNTIFGKMFIDANKAYRGMVRIGFGSNKDVTIVNGIADPTTTFEDEVKNSAVNITLGAGIETRRGKGRLQGFYGPMAMITLGSGKVENTYGEGLSATNTNGNVARTTEDKNGSTFGITIAAFGGVEYFFAPKMSVGAEVMWGLNFNSTGEGEKTTELWDGTAVVSDTQTIGKKSNFGIDVQPNTVLSLNFHF
ncbi:MAG: hypothetical protein JKY48_03905 [Flavobacteriales bacterium]|nr:hypothetical protein [Flavobacteriales bacterium]